MEDNRQNILEEIIYIYLDISNYYCHTSSQTSISYNSKNKSDFHLTLNKVIFSGKWVLYCACGVK